MSTAVWCSPRLCRVTAVDDPDAAWRLLVEDALTAIDVITARAPGSLIDVGSGGGSPGIPIAIETGIPTVLLEARERKAEFLRSAVEQLQLDCEVVAARSEDHARGPGREGYDMALARALAPPPVAVELCLPLVRPGGWLVLWTAAIDARQLEPVAEQLGGGIGETVPVSDEPAAGRGGQDRLHPAALPAAPRRGRETSARLATIEGVNGRVYALANQKGGVGKTTTAINMAACVAEAGTPVLLIDLDPQANATTGLGFRPDQLDCSTYDLLHGRPLADVVVSTSIPNLDLAPSHPGSGRGAGGAAQASRSRHAAARHPGRHRGAVSVRVRRLPALARPADGQRLVGSQPTDRAGAV